MKMDSKNNADEEHGYNWYNERVKPASMPKKVEVFDTTLRDGEQTPGVALSPEQKIEIAHALNNLGVDIIEAGFPVSSEGGLSAVKAIAVEIDTTVCALARCVQKDIDACIEADVDLVHIFIGTSSLHRKYKLKMTKEQILKSAEDSIQYCKDHGFKVHFSPEDACRTEIDYLKQVCKLAQDMEVSHINIPDTVGIMTPASMRSLISQLKEDITVPLAVHCHNDFGMAVANTLAGIEAGATVPHVTINGLGERAGNADLEQVVLACELIYGTKTNIVKEKIYETSRMVSRITGIRVMPNFPIVGDNAFAHESGIHVHGVLAKALTYEPIKPEMVGAKRRLVIGKLIGAHGVESKLSELGISVTKEQVEQITKKVKQLGDKGKKVVEEDLIAIAEDIIGKAQARKEVLKVVDIREHIDMDKKPLAFVIVEFRGERIMSAREGVGPVDAALNAIRDAIGEEGIVLEEYHLDAITGGSNALAEVMTRVGDGKKSAISRGVHEDIVMASVDAFVNGVNKILS